jgi:hypothetical protein
VELGGREEELELGAPEVGGGGGSHWRCPDAVAEARKPNPRWSTCFYDGTTPRTE